MPVGRDRWEEHFAAGNGFHRADTHEIRLLTEAVRPHPGAEALDVGCGLGPMPPHWPAWATARSARFRAGRRPYRLTRYGVSNFLTAFVAYATPGRRLWTAPAKSSATPYVLQVEDAIVAVSGDTAFSVRPDRAAVSAK